MSEKPYDLIVYGASSFVGQILTHYLHQRHGENGDLRWALAGRNRSKLEEVNKKVAANLPILVADAHDKQALTDVMQLTKVVVSTVGPYDLYGSTLVEVCAENGIHYCDLTGEAQWMRKMIDQHQATAEKSGARIVHNCGFDSLPSDLGVLFLQNHAKAKFGSYCNDIRCGVKGAKGGMSGGTLASLTNLIKQARSNPALRKELQNPYSVCPPDYRKGVRQRNVSKPEFDSRMNSWLAPWIMAAINTRVVHRSNALAGQPYGADFKYDESMMMGPGFKGRSRATTLAAGLAGFLGLTAIGPTRKVLEKYVLPKPGEGPSPQEQQQGFWDYRLYGQTANGDNIVIKAKGDRDPGYGSTGKMLGEAALCLVEDAGNNVGGGFWTPATALGEALIDRLVAHAGVSFERLS